MFFCRVVAATAEPSRFQETLDAVTAVSVPAAMAIPGFAGQYWLGDRETGELLTCTYFDSREALEGSRQAGQEIRAAASKAGGAQIHSVSEYEVIANTGDKVHTGATHARATRSKGDPAQAERTIAMIKGTVIPKAQELAGFAGGVWMLDRQTGEGLSLTLYGSPEAIRESADAASKIRSQAMDDGQLELLNVKDFEIVARTETPAAVAG